MHSNVLFMLRKLDVSVPFGHGALRISPFPLSEGVPVGRGSINQNNYLIHLFIN